MSPFHNRLAEWELYSPLPEPGTMLELGNKKNGDLTYKAYFESLGWKHTSVDWNGEDGALKRDLRQPLLLGTYDVVTNIGTSEHVDRQAGVWGNICNALRVGSLLLSTTPLPGDWTWHGKYHPDEDWYRELCEINGLKIERLYVTGEAPRRMIFLRAVREFAKPFAFPSRAIHFNPEGN